MKRRTSLTDKLLNKDVFRQMIKDIENILKGMFGSLLQQFLEAEMDEALGYSKYDYKNKSTDNSRNGYSTKQVKASMGKMDVSIPRDRKSEFEPRIIPKYSKEISPSIEDRILSMYAKGMSMKDIHDHIQEIYGLRNTSKYVLG